MSYTSGGTTEVTDYTYDANNRLTNEATSVVGDVKSAIRYYYDKYGNQVKTETIGDTTLTTQNEYDYLDRVTTATDAASRRNSPSVATCAGRASVSMGLPPIAAAISMSGPKRMSAKRS